MNTLHTTLQEDLVLVQSWNLLGLSCIGCGLCAGQVVHYHSHKQTATEQWSQSDVFDAVG